MAPIAKTPAILRSEILIKSSGYAGWFILLEGDFDQRFWESRLNLPYLKPINCVGKLNVLGTLGLLTSTNQAQKIIALADKDYDEILVQLRQVSQLVYTDENDLEVTLLRCSSSATEPAMDRILRESVDESKRKSFETNIGYSVVEHLRQMAASYGVLRLINERLQSGVNFDHLPILHNSFIDHSTLQQNLAALQGAFVNAVNQAGKIQLTTVDLAEQIEFHRQSGLFLGWALVQGHDLMQLLATAINSNALKDKTQASEDSLARDLCLTIYKNDLQATVMFQKVCKYGNLAGVTFFW